MKYPLALSETDQKKLEDLYSFFEEQEKFLSGYPCTSAFDYTELYKFLKFPINNIGDPFRSSGIWRMNTHRFEVEVLNFFAEILHADKDFHGYVTNGGTEGNLYGMNLAKSIYRHGYFYVSAAAHYSIFKIFNILGLPHEIIPAQKNGEINYEALSIALDKKRQHPPLIIANIGSTMMGAIDNIATINNILNALKITQYYIHCDAALSGMILPFVENPPPFDFAHRIHSLAISGHKFIGSPIPCGVVITNKNYMTDQQHNVEYVNIMDTTVTGSRNGVTPLFLWYAIKRLGKQGLKDRVQRCLENAQYAVDKMQNLGIAAWRNKYSNIVIFPKPSDKIVKKWHMAPEKDIAHIITNPHVTKPMIDDICRDLTNAK